jgi:GT2 family glycosyltransferase
VKNKSCVIYLQENVSVIISTYSKDMLNLVLDCIESIKKQSLLPKEIILVLDPCQSLVDFYKSQLPSDIKIVISEEFGLSEARNAGVKSAKVDIVAFIDDDAIAEKNWLENLVKNYDNPSVAGAGGLIKPLWEEKRPKWFPEEIYWVIGCSYKGLPECKTNVRNPIGCNMSFRRSVFEKVGNFKPNIGRFGKKLLAGEEMEFSVRVLGKIENSTIVYDPSAVVYHRVRKNRTDLIYVLRRSFYEGMSKALIINSKSKKLKVLSSEAGYLSYLLKTAVPSRLLRIYKFENFCQFAILFLSSVAVLMGFFLGKHIKK